MTFSAIGKESNSMTSTSSSDAGSSSSLTSAADTDTAVPQIIPERILESKLSSGYSETVRCDVSQSVDNGSLSVSGGDHSLPQQITSKELKNHVPNTEKYIQVYMSAMLFGSNRIIPLWNPSPGLETDPQEWRYHVNIGDVGFFNDEGGFDTLFNIFLPKEQNHDHHYTPPDDFVHCALNPRLALRDVALPPSKRIMARGFAGLPNDSPVIDLSNSRHVNAAQCSALYIHSGYQSATIRQYDRPGILEYIRRHHESWQLYVEHKFAGQLQDRPLLIIFSSYRTKTCAMAAGTKPSVFRSWKPKVTLREFIEGDHKSYVWETNDNQIQTNFSPSKSFRDSLETYIENLDLDNSKEVRKELEGCHCVAVGVYGFQKKGWMKGGSVITGKSSNGTVKPFYSRMSLPVRFGSSVRKELDYRSSA
ncbi:hypothetical protein BJ912DRAFT_983048, partial [Pholiota molesta]